MTKGKPNKIRKLVVSELHIQSKNDASKTYSINIDDLGDKLSFSNLGTAATKKFVINPDGTTAAIAPALTLTADNQIMTFGASNTLDPANQSVTFTASIVGDTGKVTFTAVDNNGNNITLRDGDSDKKTILTGQNFGNVSSVTVTAKAVLDNDGSILTDDVIISKVQSGVAGADGEDGSDGNDAKAIKVTSNDYQIAYNKAGASPSPSSITITATQQNHTGTFYYHFYVDNAFQVSNQTGSWTGLNVNSTLAAFGAKKVVKVETRTASGQNQGTLLATDSITIIGTKDGSDAITVVGDNLSHTLPAENNGSVTSYAGSGINFEVYIGGTQLTANTSATQVSDLSENQFGITESASDIVVNDSPSATNSGKTYTYGVASAATQSADNPSITFSIFVKDSAGNSRGTIKQVQTFSKSKKGSTGATGTGAKVVTLSADKYIITYNGAGALSPGSQAITLTAIPQGHSGTVYYDFLIDDTSKQNTTTATYTIQDADEPSAGGSKTIKVKTREGSNSGTVISEDTISVFGVKQGADGKDAITVVMPNDNHAFVANAAGTVSSYSGGGTDLFVFEGASRLTPTTGTPGTSQFSVSVAETDIEVDDSPTLDTSDPDKRITYGDPGNMTADTAKLVYTITAKNSANETYTFTKQQSFSKSKTGETGTDAKLVKLIYDKQAFTFGGDGNASPANQLITITGSLQNTTATKPTWTITDANGDAFTNFFSAGGYLHSSNYSSPSNNVHYAETFAGCTKDVSGVGTSTGNPAQNGTWTNGVGSKNGNDPDNGYPWNCADVSNPGSGPNVTPSSGTGAQTAVSGSKFLYAEASSATSGIGQNKWVTLQRQFTAEQTKDIAKMSFYYHMHGDDTLEMGTITVSASLNGSSWDGLPIVKDMGGTPTSCSLGIQGQQHPNQSDAWKRAEVDLRSYNGSSFYVRIAGITGQNAHESDFCIDAIEFIGYETPSAIAINDTQFASNTLLKVKAAADGLNDEVTLVKLSDGAAGADAITCILTNESHTLQTAANGTVNYTDSGTEIKVFKGTTELNSVTTTPGTGEFKVTAVADNINAPTIGASQVTGNPVVIGNFTNMTADQAKVTYTINAENTVSLTKVQSFSKSKAGTDGDDGEDANAKFNQDFIEANSGWGFANSYPTSKAAASAGTFSVLDLTNTQVAYAGKYGFFDFNSAAKWIYNAKSLDLDTSEDYILKMRINAPSNATSFKLAIIGYNTSDSASIVYITEGGIIKTADTAWDFTKIDNWRNPPHFNEFSFKFNGDEIHDALGGGIIKYRLALYFDPNGDQDIGLNYFGLERSSGTKAVRKSAPSILAGASLIQNYKFEIPAEKPTGVVAESSNPSSGQYPSSKFGAAGIYCENYGAGLDVSYMTTDKDPGDYKLVRYENASGTLNMNTTFLGDTALKLKPIDKTSQTDGKVFPYLSFPAFAVRNNIGYDVTIRYKVTNAGSNTFAESSWWQPEEFAGTDADSNLHAGSPSNTTTKCNYLTNTNNGVGDKDGTVSGHGKSMSVGKYNNNPTTSTRSLLFGGVVGDYIDIGSAGEWINSTDWYRYLFDTISRNQNKYSIQYWIKPDTSQSNHYPRLLDINDSYGIIIYWSDGYNSLRLRQAYSTTYNGSKTGYREWRWSWDMEASNTWQHIVFTFNDAESTGANKAKLYINGVDKGTATLHNDGTVSGRVPCIDESGGSMAKKFIIGGGQPGHTYSNAGATHRGFKGHMCHVAWWNKLLTSSEVTSLYNSGDIKDPRYVDSHTLLHYWPMDETSETDGLKNRGLGGSAGTMHGTNNGLTAASDSPSVSQFHTPSVRTGVNGTEMPAGIERFLYTEASNSNTGKYFTFETDMVNGHEMTGNEYKTMDDNMFGNITQTFTTGSFHYYALNPGSGYDNAGASGEKIPWGMQLDGDAASLDGAQIYVELVPMNVVNGNATNNGCIKLPLNWDVDDMWNLSSNYEGVGSTNTEAVAQKNFKDAKYMPTGIIDFTNDVFVNTGRDVNNEDWVAPTSQGNPLTDGWIKCSFDLEPYRDMTFKLRFVIKTGKTFSSDIAITNLCLPHFDNDGNDHLYYPSVMISRVDEMDPGTTHIANGFLVKNHAFSGRKHLYTIAETNRDRYDEDNQRSEIGAYRMVKLPTGDGNWREETFRHMPSLETSQDGETEYVGFSIWNGFTSATTLPTLDLYLDYLHVTPVEIPGPVNDTGINAWDIVATTPTEFKKALLGATWLDNGGENTLGTRYIKTSKKWNFQKLKTLITDDTTRRQIGFPHQYVRPFFAVVGINDNGVVSNGIDGMPCVKQGHDSSTQDLTSLGLGWPSETNTTFKLTYFRLPIYGNKGPTTFEYQLRRARATDQHEVDYDGTAYQTGLSPSNSNYENPYLYVFITDKHPSTLTISDITDGNNVAILRKFVHKSAVAGFTTGPLISTFYTDRTYWTGKKPFYFGFLSYPSQTGSPNGNAIWTLHNFRVDGWLPMIDNVTATRISEAISNQNVFHTFTGKHKCTLSNDSVGIVKGMIVEATGEYNNASAKISTLEKPTIETSVPIVRLSRSERSKNVLGVYNKINITEIGTDYFSYNQNSDNKPIETTHEINSLGEGAVWITNINGNLENGDYITTCEIPGYGMKQDTEMLCNYTVAKITMDCDFDLNASNYECIEVEHEGTTYRAAFVGCTYHCG